MQRRDTQLGQSYKENLSIIEKVTHKVGFSTLLLLYAVVVVACNPSNVLQRTGMAPAAEVTTDASAEAQSGTTPAPPADTPTPEVVATDTPTPAPPATDTAVPPTDTPMPVATPAALFYNLPQAKLTSATGLYASPNRAEFIVPVTIPQGETIYIMGRNATNSHLRAVWNTGVGWVPVSFTDFNGQRDRLQDLPVFEQEPPACAEPITTQFGFNSEWTSDKRQRIAVVADLFRSKYGPFPDSSLSLKVNSVEVESSRRPIVENGQFSLKDVVFSPGQDLQAGETVGYILNTSSDEPLTFMATIFSIPQNCQWEID